MKYPYLLISDSHYHAWDAFSTVNEDRTNSRLQIILDETKRAFLALQKAGGDTVFHAGDIFHTRGSLVPSVLNPVIDLYGRYQSTLNIYAIAGNHDLESNDTDRLTAATSALPVAFMDKSASRGDVTLVNWHHSIVELKGELERLAKTVPHHDLIIHAPVDSVIAGIPDHGLTADYLGKLGFRRVFAGHYHDHKDFGNGVYSIGALTHQTWSDVGTKAGYCLVYEDRVEWYPSNAPKFVDVPSDASTMDPSDLLDLCDGNYCRMTLPNLDAATEADARQLLTDNGAVGILFRSPKASDAMTAKRTETVTGVATISEAVTKYATLKGGEPLAKLCHRIMVGV